MRVNIIDTQQYVPTLCSIQWLKQSGATIDFGTSEMMMSDGRVITLERAASGHLLMDVINKNQELRPEEIQSQILRAAKETRTSTRTKTGRRYEAYLGEAEREAPEVGEPRIGQDSRKQSSSASEREYMEGRRESELQQGIVSVMSISDVDACRSKHCRERERLSGIDLRRQEQKDRGKTEQEAEGRTGQKECWSTFAAV